MTRIRPSRAGLLFLALAAALSCAASPALAAPRRPTIVRHVHIRRSGVYVVRIAIVSGSARRNVVRVRIGKLSRVAKTGRRRRHASVRVELAIRGRMLTIRATAKRGPAGAPRHAASSSLARHAGPTRRAGPQDAQLDGLERLRGSDRGPGKLAFDL